MKRIVATLLLLVLAWAPAHAEVKEGDWTTAPAVKPNIAPGAVDKNKATRPSLNITQPDLQVETPTYLLAPAPTRKAAPAARKKKKVLHRKPVSIVSKKKRVRKARKRKRTKRASVDRKQVAEELWWRETGNPAVFVFRDCLNHHAVRLRELAGPVPAHVQIAKAMDETCRTEFDQMARIIAGQFGEDGFRKLSEELIETTFVPAASAAQ
ncbi:MAG: hypothetical protein HKN11_20145 [Rhizobiales bacterium]|nr:hypothetical protein [Hyphomicrobiales bacterium]